MNSENALFRVAYNAERFYDYNRAVRTFVQLAKRYPDGENVADASYNVARLLEQTQDYKVKLRPIKTTLADSQIKRMPLKSSSPPLNAMKSSEIGASKLKSMIVS